MKALLESSIRWNNIQKHPKDSYRYHVRQATIEKETNILSLEVGLNFIPSKEDEQRMGLLLRSQFPQISHVNIQLTYMEKLPGSAEVLRLVEEAPVPGNGKNGMRGAKGGWQKQESPIVGNRLMGKKIDEPSVPIAEIIPGTGAATIEGQIFKKEARAIKGGKQLLSLLITDFTDSACIKAFVSEKKWAQMDELLKEGDYIKVRGSVEFDSFENADVMKARDMEKLTVTEATDAAVEKRVELHAHTKMSAMDGLIDVQDLIETAAGWGHKAIAITDHGVVQAFPDAAKYVRKKKLDIKVIYGLEGYLVDDESVPEGSKFDYKAVPSYHIILLAKDQTGLRNLYKLVSLSHLEYFYRKPRIPKSILRSLKEGLIIGSACEAGEVFQGLLKGLAEDEFEEMLSLYDYLEIQPLINNRFLINEGRFHSEEELKELNRKIVCLGEKYNKPVVATCDSHYIKEREALYRRILMAGQGYKDAESGEGLYFRTTEEMLNEFSYLGEETARRVVIENPGIIADAVGRVSPVPDGSFRPEIPDADQRLREGCINRAVSIYGDPLPKIVADRLEKELHSIISNGYAVLYISAELLVKRSLSDGYLVGSRGSVGSSLAATMAGITEVNPLPAHYICENPECKHSEFITDNSYDCGVDLPDKCCPQCGMPYRKDGFNIPFETFLGFEGDKEPDIDLNFAGEYQPVAHKFVEEIFGRENVFRAGTISTVAGKTAFGFVRKYYDEKQKSVSKWEAERLTQQCTGVRRTTGQHPGGIIILPRGHEIYEFCPIQRPANDTKTDIITTHFDYHSIDENLLKLDILGHDVPSMIRMLADMTGLDPLRVPLKDPKVDGLFNGIDGLDIKVDNYQLSHGTYGIPEFGTQFVRQMLDDIKPTQFSDLIRISGLSHGTDVWINNAQSVIRNGDAGIQEVICTRDDIMNGLIAKGLPPKTAFKIMESVRKGKGITDEEARAMEEHNVDQWYIESCRKIGYMFPKAHAVAYVMMSYRIAYYKVYYPLAFYATFFTMKIADFDAELIMSGLNKVWSRIKEITEKGKAITQKEADALTVLEVAYEMLARGFEFAGVDLNESTALKFTVKDGKVQLPFRAIVGVGDTAASNLAAAREKGSFLSIDDLRMRAKLNKTAIEALQRMGVLDNLPESNQLMFL
ncbi:MAG: PolC-type DNA polymerase III [Clostridiales bacterium]|nr:PolC-type DNA polymerase III [Clostridiales bacterium]